MVLLEIDSRYYDVQETFPFLPSIALYDLRLYTDPSGNNFLTHVVCCLFASYYFCRSYRCKRNIM